MTHTIIMASINWSWFKLCCRVPVREKDDGEWMEPIKRKKSSGDGTSSTDNNNMGTTQKSGGPTKKVVDPWRLTQMGAPNDAAWC